MANYHTLFSLEVADLTAEEHDWFVQLGIGSDQPADETSQELIDMLGVDEDPEFIAEFERDGTVLWIYADDSGTPGHVVGVLKAFLARFRPDDFIGFEYANTCDAPRIDAFGGGAVFITATECRWMESSTWLGEQSSAWLGGKGA